MNQADASRAVLQTSQEEKFPYSFEKFGLQIRIHRGVFSPKHFHGWETFTKNFPLLPGETILEVGCGTGVTAVWLAKHGARRVLAVDINPAAVQNSLENAAINQVGNVEARESDIFSGVLPGERFDTIYWNLPFIYAPASYSYQSMLERGLFDPGYRYTDRFLREAKDHLVDNGRVLVGLGSFADMARFRALATRHGYSMKLVASGVSEEINPVEFHLHELRPIRRIPAVFFAMPFTGRRHADIVRIRRRLHALSRKYEVRLLEQFVGVEEKTAFEENSYSPLFIVAKDSELLHQADMVIADFTSHSIGRDAEVFLAKQEMDKRVIAVVPKQRLRDHPHLRLYADYLVGTREEAFSLCRDLWRMPLAPALSGLSRAQKDAVDLQIAEVAGSAGLAPLQTLMPTELTRRWELLFGPEFRTVLEHSFRPSPPTLRVNTLKADTAAFAAICHKYGWTATPLRCASAAFRVQLQRDSPGVQDTEEWTNGSYYAQDLASMLPAIALHPRPGDRILDLCAAPGSKTTQLAALMQNQGEILAVDNSPERMTVLEMLLRRYGVQIARTLIEDGRKIGALHEGLFDRVLVDGPCSCEGIIRYKPHKLLEWSLFTLQALVQLQRELLESAFLALRPGGIMVYSTCTYGPEENEAVVDWLLRKRENAEVVPMSLPDIHSREGLTSWEHLGFDATLRNAARLYPQDNDTIGFFIACIRKRGI